jgi:hypothetical protein
VVSAQHGHLVAEHQDLDILRCVRASERASSASQLSTRASIRYASRNVTAGDHGCASDGGDGEVPRLAANAQVTSHVRVLGTHTRDEQRDSRDDHRDAQ